MILIDKTVLEPSVHMTGHGDARKDLRIPYTALGLKHGLKEHPFRGILRFGDLFLHSFGDDNFCFCNPPGQAVLL